MGGKLNQLESLSMGAMIQYFQFMYGDSSSTYSFFCYTLHQCIDQFCCCSDIGPRNVTWSSLGSCLAVYSSQALGNIVLFPLYAQRPFCNADHIVFFLLFKYSLRNRKRSSDLTNLGYCVATCHPPLCLLSKSSVQMTPGQLIFNFFLLQATLILGIFI